MGTGELQRKRKVAQDVGENILAKQIEAMKRLCFSEELTQLHGGDSTSNYTEDLEEEDLISLKEYIHSIA